MISSAVMPMSEIGGSFGFDREIYGEKRENVIRTRTYSGSYAFYFLGLTAIEFDYTFRDKKTNEHTEYLLTGDLSNYSITGYNSSIQSKTYGIGFRQALAKKKSRIMPMISLGYAKQFYISQSENIFRNNTTKNVLTVTSKIQKKKIDSLFGTFHLKIILGYRLSVTGSVKTYFKAFEFNQIKDSLRYLVGFSWML
jgi:hypothetical protein